LCKKKEFQDLTSDNLEPKQAIFLLPPAVVQAQSVLYNNDFKDIKRALLSFSRATELAMHRGIVSHLMFAYGDSSPEPCLTEAQIDCLRDLCPDGLTIRYDFFGANLGSARGHNRLAEFAKADFVLIQNPDVVVSPRLLINLLNTFTVPGTGMAEAKQLPIEHPKDYDSETGETCWATTACAMIPMALFHELGGFDADTFFLYCDDVDFSWQVRLAGYKVIFQPSAVVFHDKRLSHEGKWQPSGSERYYSAEAALFLAHKWSRPDIVEKILADFDACNDEITNRAKATFEACRCEGSLPTPIDPEHQVGEFVDGMYARHRYAL
jgi:GT2 family glycosyltransferase